MLERLEIKGAGHAPAADLDIGGFIRAFGHIGQRGVGDPQQAIAQLGIFGVGLGGHGGDFGLLFGHQRAQALELGIVAAGLGGPHIPGGGILGGLRSFGGKDRRAPRLVQRQHLGRLRRQRPAAQALVEGGGIFTDGADVVHGITCRMFLCSYQAHSLG